MVQRVEHWLRCREKSCCSYYLVYVTGDDATRIARALSVPPWDITVALPCDDAPPDAFVLANGARHRLALARTRVSSDTEPSCEFLVRFADGTARCGLGEGRPHPCRTFPAQMIDGEIRFSTEGCVCDWSGVGVDAAYDAELLRAEIRAREHYAGLVAQWNDYAATLERTSDITHRDFCRFLLEMYPP